MAVYFASANASLTRSGSFFDPAQDWTICGWFWLSAYYDVATVGVVNEADFWLLDATGAFVTPWIFFGVFEAPALTLSSDADTGAGSPGDVGDIAPIAIGAWFHAALRYKASTTTLSMVLNGSQAGATLVQDLSTVSPQVHEQIGPMGNGDSAFFSTAYQRRWQAWLSDAQLQVEAASTQAALVTNLLADTPLDNVSSLQDISGNARGWTGATDIVTFDGPFAALSRYAVAGCAAHIVSCSGGGGGGTPTTYPLRRVRRFDPAFDRNINVYIQRVEVLIQSGMSNNQDMFIRFSRDGGQTFGAFQAMSAGALGESTKRLFINRLGRGRNWVFEVMADSPDPWFLIDFYIDYQLGTN
jgi:hypothetical protein